MKVEKEQVEFRYYEMSHGMPLLALLGERWVVPYGNDAMHFHNYMEVGYCYDGHGTMYLGSQTFQYEPGTITVIPKNFPHHTVGVDRRPQKWEYLFIDTDGFLKAALAGRPMAAENILKRLHSRMYMVSKETEPGMEALLKMILNEMREKREMYTEIVRGELLSLLLEMARLNPVEVVSDVRLANDQYLPEIINVLEYIERHYREEIRIEELTELSHFSETHFRRKFGEYLNTSPAEYINLLRVKKACELLSNSNDDIADIGLKVGFQTTSSFIRNFKKFMGQVPREWRKESASKIDIPVHYNVPILKGW